VRAVVTGATGFLGRHLCRLLADVYPHRVELTDPDSVQRAMDWGPSVVFHLAAMTNPRECEEDPARCHEVNVEGTRRVTARAPCRVVVVSSVHAYGPPTSLPLTEEHPLRPVGVYATSKRDAEATAPDAVIARPFNLTGPGQGPAFAPADWARQARGTGPIHCGDLELERDYLDVRDAARGLVLLARAGERGQAYNLCSGRAVTMRSIAEALAPGRELASALDRRRSGVPRLVGSNEKAARLGWGPLIALEESLADLAASLT
jgi:GDP-4-dehydro-6-deoxy-D-mannose reductase